MYKKLQNRKETIVDSPKSFPLLLAFNSVAKKRINAEPKPKNIQLVKKCVGKFKADWLNTDQEVITFS